MYSLVTIKRIYFGLSLLGSVLSQFLIFRYYRSPDLTYFITVGAVLIAIFGSYTSSASAALQFNSFLFSHHLSFRLLMLPILTVSAVLLKIDYLFTALLFAFFSVESLIPYIADDYKYYRDLIIIRILSLSLFVLVAFHNVYIAYIMLSAPLFFFMLVKQKVVFLVPYGKIYNVLSVIIILSYNQLNYFLPLEVPDGINVFGLLDRAGMLLVPLAFNLFITNSLKGVQIKMILLGLSIGVPLVIKLFLGYDVSLAGFLFFTAALLAGYINSKTVYDFNKSNREKYVFIMICIFAIGQVLVRMITQHIYLVYIAFFGIVIIVNLVIKKSRIYGKF